MPLTLWYTPGTCALASLIVLEETGAAYDARRVDFAKGEQRSDDFLKVNPKGRVPALDTGRGILTETPAIVTFLGQTFPDAGLLPPDALGLARLHELLSYLSSTVHVSHAHRLRGARWADDPAVVEALKRKVAQNMADHFAYLESRFEGPWAMGGQYTVADSYLYVLEGWLKGDGVDIAGFPKIAAHFARMGERPAVARAAALP
jgi:glutathione S-transferase